MLASDGGHSELIELLVLNGADVNMPGKGRRSALFAAARQVVQARRTSSWRTARTLMRSTRPAGLLSLRPLSEVISRQPKSLAAGANPDHADSSGDTPLMMAGSKGHLRLVRLLLGAGAMVDALNCYSNNSPYEGGF